MSIMTELKNEIAENSVSVTENGAIGYKTTGKNLLDLFFKVSSYRNDPTWVEDDFLSAWNEDNALALRFLFFARDIRNGLGERKFFTEAFKVVLNNNKAAALKMLKYIPEFGYFKDLVTIFQETSDRDVKETIASILWNQIMDDFENMQAGKPISLCAKWMPSINTSSKETVKTAKELIAFQKDPVIIDRDYRKILSKLRHYLDVVEVKMSSGEWGEINYNTVPSKANLNYKKAFATHDFERRREYLEALANGSKDVKINSGAVYPYEIIHKYSEHSPWRSGIKDYDATLEEMWKALPVPECDTSRGLIVVADGSGSMCNWAAGGGEDGATCLDVANSLAIFASQMLKGEFKDKYITFSEHPQFVDLSKATTLQGKIKEALKHDECANTNIEAVFDLILKIAIKNKMKQEDIPDILIVSDMEFDNCACSDSTVLKCWAGGLDKDEQRKLFKSIAWRWKDAGYTLPRLIFWNVGSRTGTIPVRQNDMGVALVSGFSQNIFDIVMSGDLDPFKMLLKKIDVERYNFVDDLFTK